jgi:hypothetical protein
MLSLGLAHKAFVTDFISEFCGIVFCGIVEESGEFSICPLSGSRVSSEMRLAILGGPDWICG